MSQKGNIVILVPGAGGWEVWSGPATGPYALVEATEMTHAGDLNSVPHGDVLMFFPVRSVISAPFRGATSDEELFDDLATMHIERLGLRPDEDAGQLVDSFVVSRGEEETRILTVVLRPPGEGDLPPRSPKEFDLSARAMPLPENSVALWREFGGWVFAIGGPGGALNYAQMSSCTEPLPDDSVAGDVGLALTQLALQGMSVDLQRVVVWADADVPGQAVALERAFPGLVKIEDRPPFRVPTPRSRLLPEDVRAARRERAGRQRRIALAAVALFAFLGLVGWLAFGLWQDMAKAKKLAADAAKMRPVAEAFTEHSKKWDELGPVVDVGQGPVELLFQCVRQIPANSGLRLQTAELSSDEAGGRIKQIRLVGEAPEPGPIQKFSLALTRSNRLSMFQWELPPPAQTNKGTWSFTYTGVRQDLVSP